MKKLAIYIIALLSPVIFTACEDIQIVENNSNVPEGKTATITLFFEPLVPSEIKSRAAVNTEKMVYTLDVFVFNSDGSFCSYDTFNPNVDAETTAHGITLNTTTGSNKTIYAIANMNASILASGTRSALINIAQTSGREAFLNANVNINHSINLADGNFPMSGFYCTNQNDTEATPINITSGTNSYAGKIWLTRMVSEINCEIIDDTENGCTFIPTSWQVRNLPSVSNLYEQNTDAACESYFTASDNGENAETFFNTTTSNEFQFTFYMLENRKTDETVTVATQKDRYKNDVMPQNATYLLLTGTYKGTAIKYEDFDNPNSEVTDGNNVEATVTYYIPLGDTNDENWNNYDTERNCRYKYTITVKGVNDIVTEVVKEEEDISIADGIVNYIPSGNTITVDAHYNDGYVLTFNKSDDNYNADTWGYRIKSPYTNGQYIGRNGSEITENTLNSDNQNYGPTWEETGNIPYGGKNWVHFAINDRQRNNNYSNEPITYTEALEENRLLTIDELLLAMKNNEVWDNQDNIRITCFIDEFYYKQQDYEGYDESTDAPRWYEFAGSDKENREFLILDDSKEGNGSILTQARYIISQRPIQTIYRTDGQGTEAAWGIEWVNETENVQGPTDWSGLIVNRNDGLKNTIQELGDNVSWSTINENVTNPVRASMTRNRDLNGNGIIDEEEVKWYIPAINQYQDLWVGIDAIQGDAHLYQQPEGEYWVTRYFSSTRGQSAGRNGYYVQTFWAEEGCAVSDRGDYTANQTSARPAILAIRCARNMNTTYTTNGSYNNDNADYISAVQYAEVDESGRFITLPGLNPAAVRDAVSNSLPLHNEYDYGNRVSANGFYYANSDERTPDGQTWYNLIIEDNGQDAENECGNGYRVPNQRELILMDTKAGLFTNHYQLCKTYSSYWQGWGFEHGRTSSALGYWVGGFIYNIEQHAVTLNPGTWYYGGTDGNNPRDNYYYIRCVRDNAN